MERERGCVCVCVCCNFSRMTVLEVLGPVPSVKYVAMQGIRVCEAPGLDLQAWKPGCNLTPYQVYAFGSRGWESTQLKTAPP